MSSRPKRCRLIALILAALAAPGLAAELDLAPCELPGLAGEARCGTYEVFENRRAGEGRKIALRVVVLPATGENPEPDPIVFFAGGPGASTVEMAVGAVTFYAHVLEKRDFLLVDYRGSGGSNPLFCPYQEDEKGIEEALETFIPVEQLDACRDALDGGADLAQYTTPNIVDDVEEVRRALGYGQVNLWGGSYGSRAVLVYLRRHPQAVRTAMIEGVVPTLARMPVSFAADSQAALDGWLRECAEDGDCAAAFPDPAADLGRALAQLDEAPVRVDVFDPRTRQSVEMTLSRPAFVQALRYLLYDSGGSLKVPAFLHAAAAGDWGPMAQAAYSVGGLLMAGLPDGLYLSVTCAEDVALIGPNAGALQRGTFLGDFRLRQQVAACEEWVSGELPDGFHDPVRSDAPVLIVSGERDPVTPERWGRQAEEFLPNSVHLVVPNGAHSWFGLQGVECLGGLWTQLLDTGSTRDLDVAGCRQAIHRPSFLLEIPKDEEVEMSRAELERFVGTYAAEAGGFQVLLEVTDEGLIATFGEDSDRMVPLGPTRFKLAGAAPGDYLDFAVEGSEVRSVEVIRGGVAQLRLVKE